MNRTAILAGAATSLLLAASGAGAQTSWTPAVRERMLADAVKLAPPALARVMLRHPDALRTGSAEPSLTEGGPQHRQAGDGPDGAAAALAEAGRSAIEAMNGHRPLAEVARRLGIVAHLAADLNDPFLASSAGAGRRGTDFGLFVERQVHRFPVVFYGWPGAADLEAGDLQALGLAAARLARAYRTHLDRAYDASGDSSAGFDVRSIPFGIASICYSRAVTDIARAWLLVWRGARGDVGGTPLLDGNPPPAPHPEEPAQAAARETAPAPGRPGTAPAAPRPATVPGGLRPVPPEEAGPAAEAPPDPNGASLTRTIYGKSRKKTTRAADPNAAPPADPNRKE